MVNISDSVAPEAKLRMLCGSDVAREKPSSITGPFASGDPGPAGVGIMFGVPLPMDIL